jgi:hypothetical protein
MSSASSKLIGAIEAVTHDPRVILSMALGAQLEGGYGPTFRPGDNDTSFGPFQIHLPAHPGVTATEADNPQWAAKYMVGAYKNAVSRVPAALWGSNPEAAAEQAAFLAERPKQDYVASRGQQAVDAAYGNAVRAIQAAGTGGGGGGLLHDAEQWSRDIVSHIPLIGGHGVPNPANIPGDIASGVTGDVEKGVSALFAPALKDAKTGVAYIGFAGAGLALLVGGLLSLTKGPRDRVKAKGEEAATTAAEVAALA